MANIYISDKAHLAVPQWGGGRNLVANSASGYSGGNGMTYTTGQADPWGGTTAVLATETAASSTHRIEGPHFTALATTPYVQGVHVKAGTKSIIQLVMSGVFSSQFANFDLTNGVIGNANTPAGMISLGSGWWFCYLLGTSIGAGASQAIRISGITALTDGVNPSYAGSTGNTFYMAGATADFGSVPTYPYKPTTGSAVEPTGSQARTVGDLIRATNAHQLGERVYRCTTAGTSGATEPVWDIGKGRTTTDGTAVWTEVTGQETYGWSAPHYRAGLPLTPTNESYPGSGAVTAAGSGYTVGDILTVNSGATLAAGAANGPLSTKVKVTTVDGSGGVTGYTNLSAGAYYSAPAAPMPVTGGTGTGCTITRGTMVNSAYLPSGGDTAYISSDHKEMTGPNSSGGQDFQVGNYLVATLPSPQKIISVNRAGSVPPVAADLQAGAEICHMGRNYSWSFIGSYAFGLTLRCKPAATTTAFNFQTCGAGGNHIFEECIFWLDNLAQNTYLGLGNVGTSVICYDEFINCQFRAGFGYHFIEMNNGFLKWRNPDGRLGLHASSAEIGNTSGAANTPLIRNAGRQGEAFLECVDLSNLTSTASHFMVNASGYGNGTIIAKDCKLSATAPVIGSVPSGLGSYIKIINCDSGDTVTRNENHQFPGSETTETTVVRTGGASDGTTTFARKVVTNANPEFFLPMELLPITFWNETVGSPITVTIEGLASAVPTNEEVWMDVEYLGTSGSPLGKQVTTRKANILSTAAAGTASAAAWTTTGVTTPTAFKMSATFTPQERGPVTIYVKVAKVSSTIYIDPKPTVS